ncbi:MAG: HdeD family acid-resistance protein [Victivallales bacterium]|nr:HdeD family acid-resistance protein [Victivallales bacterium]
MSTSKEMNDRMEEELNVAETMAEKFIGKVPWKIMLLRSLASIIAGIMVFSWPVASLVAIAMIIGVYFIFNGIMAFSAAFSLNRGKIFMFLYGLLCIFAGSIAFKNPLLTDFIIMIFIATWAIFNGVSEIGLCAKMHGNGPARFAFGFTGIISIVFGAIVLFNLKSSLGIFIWITGFYLLMTGFSMLFITLSLRRIQNNTSC